MPTSSQRPWSTQYQEDYNRKTSGWHRKRTTKPKLTTRWTRPRVPQATPVVTMYNPPVYAGRFYGMEDPLCPSDEEEDCLRTNPAHVAPTLPEQVIDRPLYVDAGMVTEVEPVIPEPTEISREPHWICWPEPKKSKRPHTSLGFHRETNTEVCCTGNDQLPTKGAPLTYEPELKGWTNATKENERQTVDMYSTLQRSQSFYEPTRRPMTSISVNEPPARDTYSLYGRGNASNTVDPTGIYRQSFFPYHKPGGHGVRDQQLSRMMLNRMEGQEPRPYKKNFSFDKYPLHMRSNRFPVVSEDYVHDQSMFMTTTPRCTGHYIINPDWVSERSGLRRSNTMIMPNKVRNSAFKY